MAIVAVQAIRRLKGGAQSLLMLGSDGLPWVVKFRNNPQHVRVLANEFIVTRLAAAIGLTVPVSEVIEVPRSLVDQHPQLMIYRSMSQERCATGSQFGSQFVGGLAPGELRDSLSSRELQQTRNLREFAGMLCVDKWTSNTNGRQAVFHRRPRERKYRATFIDHGFCFVSGDWTFLDHQTLRGNYAYKVVYEHVTGWHDFEPWLSRIELLEQRTVWDVAEAVPEEWYGSFWMLEQLMDQLLRRRNKVRELISAFRFSRETPFPNWVS